MLHVPPGQVRSPERCPFTEPQNKLSWEKIFKDHRIQLLDLQRTPRVTPCAPEHCPNGPLSRFGSVTFPGGAFFYYPTSASLDTSSGRSLASCHSAPRRTQCVPLLFPSAGRCVRSTWEGGRDKGDPTAQQALGGSVCPPQPRTMPQMPPPGCLAAVKGSPASHRLTVGVTYGRAVEKRQQETTWDSQKDVNPIGPTKSRL